jgi:hypothetical protein
VVSAALAAEAAAAADHQAAGKRMFQRDYIMTEARKLALLLARLLGLKAEGEYEEYLKSFDEVLKEEYDTELELLIGQSEASFIDTVSNSDYSAEKLNALAHMLFVFAEPFKNDEETALLLKKVMAIFHVLETRHHYDSFENITRRKAIYNFFNNHYERS